MKDLKQLIDEIENRRKKRQRSRIVLGAVAGLLIVGSAGTVFTLTKSHLAKQVPKKEVAPKVAAVDVYRDVVISGKAAIVYDLTTGEVIYAKNADTQLPLASLTKLLSIYAAAGTLSESSIVTMSAAALATEGENGFTEGETFTFGELARLALVASSNDAAEAIAETASARRAESSSALLASAATALNLSKTYAVNGTGLDENGTLSGGYGSAHDIAVLAGELLKRVPGIARATIDPTVTAYSQSGRSYTLKNTNPGVTHIPGLMLSKTGYTDLAGGNLAVVFDAGIQHPIAVVVLGSTIDDRFIDVDRLVRATTRHFSSISLP